MKKVNVLLSAYNGEKYIRQQLDSLLEQTYANVKIFVRDDGSSDHTADIIREYEEKGLVVAEYGKNVGFIKSFFRLVANCDEADYYAYCDQDDVWMPEKLEMAVEMLDKEACDIPVLYFSNYDFYNEYMEFVEHAFPDDFSVVPEFRNSLVDCITLGFNSVFNDKARCMMKKDMPRCATGHDWWTYMLCQGLGKVIYDKRPTVKYRRTGTNVSPGGSTFIKHQIWRIKTFIIKDTFSQVRKMHQEFYYLYKDELCEKDRKLLSLFARKHYNLIAALAKTFYPHMFRKNIIDEIMVRFFFLIGRL